MDQQVQEKELEVETKTSALTQTELDLANAVVLIQEKEAKLVELESERDQAVEVVAELINEIPLEPKPKSVIPNLALTDLDADNVETTPTATHAGFGTSFPTDPQKGDLFLRVDTLPNKLYKWNEKKWIEVDKTINDRYAYDEEYIKYITQKILTGEYSMDDLSKPEQEAILKTLSYEQKSRL